jgi:hypothetical protein
LARAGTIATTFSRQLELTRVRGFFRQIISRILTDLISGETSHKWTAVLIDGDFDKFETKNSGGKHSSSFYDVFPELETEAKVFAHEGCAQKSAAFTAIDLA